MRRFGPDASGAIGQSHATRRFVLNDLEINDLIFSASTLEEAIAWRRMLSFRLCASIAKIEYDDPYYASKVGEIIQAKFCIDCAINRLLAALASNERLEWFPPYPPVISHRATDLRG